MRKALTVARRELGGYFYSPMAYVVGALFLLVAGWWFFHSIFRPGQEASLRSLFEVLARIMVFAAPLLTMRLMSEEYRSGTIEKLITSPVSEPAIIVGKFLGVLGFYGALLGSTLVFLVLVSAYGRPDAGVALMGYLGMALLGAAFLAVGLFTSCLTRYQIVAALLAIAILAVFALLMQQVSASAGQEWVRDAAAKVNAMSHFRDFAQGMFDTRGLVYFLSATAIFLFLSVKALESRRWR
jgi:ABC-2 type transport system permease protein